VLSVILIVTTPIKGPTRIEQAGISEAALAVIQHQVAQQAALASVPDPVKRVGSLLVVIS